MLLAYGLGLKSDTLLCDLAHDLAGELRDLSSLAFLGCDNGDPHVSIACSSLLRLERRAAVLAELASRISYAAEEVDDAST